MGYLGLAKNVPATGPARVPLVDYVADQMASIVRLTMRETENVARDVGLLHEIREVIERHPGANRVLMRVVTLDGKRVLVRWDAFADAALRRELGLLLASHAMSERTTEPTQAAFRRDRGA